MCIKDLSTKVIILQFIITILISCSSENYVLNYEEQELVEVKNHTLLVTHATEAWDGAIIIKEELDELISINKSKNRDIIYLVAAVNWIDTWFTEEKNPTLAIFSDAGEHFLNINTEEITLSGGYWGACLANTIVFSIESAFKNNSYLRINLPMKAIFVSAHRTLYSYYIDNLDESEFNLSNYIREYIDRKPTIRDFNYNIYLDDIEISTFKNSEKHLVELYFYTY